MSAIQSLLDNDLYKFTMMQAVREQQPNATASYRFINRRESNTFSPASVERIRHEIQQFCKMSLTPAELEFLATLPFIKPDFVHYLKNFQLKPETVQIELNQGKLQIHIQGSWLDTILWEVPLMAIISQTYFEIEDTNWDHDLKQNYYQKTLQKGQRLTAAQCKFIDFGTRRRRSFATQETVVRAFKDPTVNCAGTSNVYLAMQHNLQPVGTMAHEWIMAYAGLQGVANANVAALQAWRNVYGDQLGVALTDTYTSDQFFQDINGQLAKDYAALRHDSECPIQFADKVLDFYQAQGIDPTTKSIVFSDSLNVDKAIQIQQHIAQRCQTAYGIGTHFTNDFANSPALNIVIKLYSINCTHVAKISDNPIKASGAPEAIKAALAAIQ